MRGLIVDDDKMSRLSLEKFCQKIEDITIVGTCSDGLEALDFLSKNSIDLLLVRAVHYK